MSEVVFVREVVGDRDLVLAFGRDGRPLWALDLERDLQFWYPGGSTAEVRAAIADAWPGFELMPVLARSPDPGRHAAVELGRRAEAAEVASAPGVPPVGDDVLSWLRRRWTRSSRVARLAVVGVGGALVLVAGATWLGGPPPAPAPLPLGVDGRTVTVPQAAGSPCDVRGELARTLGGQLLVCVSDERASPWVLAWRPTG